MEESTDTNKCTKFTFPTLLPEITVPVNDIEVGFSILQLDTFTIIKLGDCIMLFVNRQRNTHYLENATNFEVNTNYKAVLLIWPRQLFVLPEFHSESTKFVGGLTAVVTLVGEQLQLEVV